MHGEFSRLAKDDDRFDADLGRTYNLKTKADYEVGPGSDVSGAEAAQAIDTARRFVAAIETVICE